MKRIFYAALLAIASLLASFPAAAQHFTCAQYETDAKRWQDIEQLFKRQGWAQWALAVKDAFPLNNDRSIQFKYVIASDVACSQKQLTDLVQSAKSETFVEFKENRLRITVTVSRYVMGAASPFQINSDTPLVGDCYPFDLNGKWKNVLAMAYINSNQKALDQVASLLNYLNRHTATPSKADKDW